MTPIDHKLHAVATTLGYRTARWQRGGGSLSCDLYFSDSTRGYRDLVVQASSMFLQGCTDEDLRSLVTARLDRAEPVKPAPESNELESLLIRLLKLDPRPVTNGSGVLAIRASSSVGWVHYNLDTDVRGAHSKHDGVLCWQLMWTQLMEDVRRYVDTLTATTPGDRPVAPVSPTTEGDLSQ